MLKSPSLWCYVALVLRNQDPISGSSLVSCPRRLTHTGQSPWSFFGWTSHSLSSSPKPRLFYNSQPTTMSEICKVAINLTWRQEVKAMGSSCHQELPSYGGMCLYPSVSAGACCCLPYSCSLQATKRDHCLELGFGCVCVLIYHTEM